MVNKNKFQKDLTTKEQLLLESLERKKNNMDLEKELRPLEEGETFYYDEETGEFSIRKKDGSIRKQGIPPEGPYQRKRKDGDVISGGKVLPKMEAAKGGEVKGYHKGGPVHKKKNTMATTKGWGISRKT